MSARCGDSAPIPLVPSSAFGRSVGRLVGCGGEGSSSIRPTRRCRFDNVSVRLPLSETGFERRHEGLGGVGQFDEFSGLDIDASIQDAVGSVGAEIESTIGGAVGSIGASMRGAVVVLLFALAALATTAVAWRVARIGVMILNGPRQSLLVPPSPPRYESSERRAELEMV